MLAVLGDRLDIRLGLTASHQGVHRPHDEEEHSGRDRQERNERVEEVAVGKGAVTDGEVGSPNGPQRSRSRVAKKSGNVLATQPGPAIAMPSVINPSNENAMAIR